jgi:hypothetical protein
MAENGRKNLNFNVMDDKDTGRQENIDFANALKNRKYKSV